jgi:hypothetical protein
MVMTIRSLGIVLTRIIRATSVILITEGLRLRGLPNVGCNGFSLDGGGRRRGRRTFRSGRLRALNGEGEPLHGAILVELRMA